jgi:hypothetical protein
MFGSRRAWNVLGLAICTAGAALVFSSRARAGEEVCKKQYNFTHWVNSWHSHKDHKGSSSTPAPSGDSTWILMPEGRDAQTGNIPHSTTMRHLELWDEHLDDEEAQVHSTCSGDGDGDGDSFLRVGRKR